MAMLAVNEQATTGALYAVNEPVATVDEPAVTVNEPAATAAVPMLAAVEQHQSTHDDAAEDSPPPFLARTSARVDVLKDGRLQETLRHIDSAPTREAALRRLEKALAHEDFDGFTRTALREIGYVRDEAAA